MRRGGSGAGDAILGAHAWAYLRRDPDYRADWAAQACVPVFEAAGYPLRVQGEADLQAEAAWSLLA